MTTAARAEGLRYEDVERGDVAAVVGALARGAEVNAPVVSGDQGETRRPLLVAARTGSLELVRLLVARGAAIEHGMGEGDGTAFEAAVTKGHGKIASYLLDAPSRPSKDYLALVLRVALSSRLQGESDLDSTDDARIVLARRALAKGLRRDEPEVRLAFHALAVTGDLRGLELLLHDAHVDPNLPAEVFERRSGRSAYDPPLVDAARNGHLDAVRTLLDHGARPDAQGKLGMTALHLAARSGRSDIAKLLLARGASAAVLDAEGHRAVWLARRARMPVEHFAAAGAALTAAEEAEVFALEAAQARKDAEWQADAEERDRRRARRDLAIAAGAFAGWVVYLWASVAARRGSAGSAFAHVGRELNLWAGPVLAGAGVGALAVLGMGVLLSGGPGIPAIVDPRRPAFLAGLPAMIAVGALHFAHRSDLAAHPWLYYTGPVLSVGIPLALFVLRS